MLEKQVLQIVVGAMGKFRLVNQLRTDLEPRKERTISLFVVSVATNPVMSDLMELVPVSVCHCGCAVNEGSAYFSNSVRVFVLAASTRAQFPCGQVIFVLGLLLLPRQYAAAEYWLKNWS